MPGMLLTRFQWTKKRVPAPLSGVTPSLEKAETRKVLMVPGPVFRTLLPTVHPIAVSPAAAAGAVPGVGAAIAESKVKSPWKPMYFRPGSINVVVIG